MTNEYTYNDLADEELKTFVPWLKDMLKDMLKVGPVTVTFETTEHFWAWYNLDVDIKSATVAAAVAKHVDYLISAEDFAVCQAECQMSF